MCVQCSSAQKKNERSAHARIMRLAKNPCFLIDWSCGLPFKEDRRRMGCHEYELCGSLVFNLGKCGNEPARNLTWGGWGWK